MDIEKIQKTKREIGIWEWAARVLPFIALSGIIAAWYFNLESILDYFILSVIMIVTAITVFWWWWAISKIAFLANMFDATAQRLEKINEEIKDFKKDLRE